MEFSLSRFKDIETRQFKCEVVTPMFLGGADGKSAELRAASIKGALRFWWRALYGGDDIEDMKKREADIFGSTDKKSNLVIHVDTEATPKNENLPKGAMFKTRSKGKTFSISIINYLAYGLYEYEKGRGNIYKRYFFTPGSNFEVTLKYNKNYESEILDSFQALVLYGGLGSRSRNGFGSFHCKKISKLDKSISKNLSQFTAFSKETKVFIFDTYDSWVDALSEIGLVYREARLSLEEKHNFFKRALIAMPIEAKNENIPNDIKKGRHTKPYFLHVNKLENGKFQGQILFMPYKYSPNGKYDENKFNEYLKASNKMNDYISSKSKEVKNEF